jgi:hypothetical protein
VAEPSTLVGVVLPSRKISYKTAPGTGDQVKVKLVVLVGADTNEKTGFFNVVSVVSGLVNVVPFSLFLANVN